MMIMKLTIFLKSIYLLKILKSYLFNYDDYDTNNIFKLIYLFKILIKLIKSYLFY